MNTQIITNTFQNNDIRIILINNKPWFIAKDIAELLDIKDSRGAIRDLRNRLNENNINLKDVISTHPLETNGGIQEFTIVSETGLYELVFASRKKEAISFRFWITNEVLPSIRKTGNYSISQKLQIPEIKNETQKMIELKNHVLETSNLIEILRNLNQIDLFRLEQYFLANFRYSILDKFKIDLENQFFLPTELGKMINKSPIEINLMIANKGFQIRENGVWKMTSSGEDLGIEINGKFSQLKWKMRTVL